MEVKHGCCFHDVDLMDDGTMDTVIRVDGTEHRFSEADRCPNGQVKRSWLREVVIELCEDGSLKEDTDEG